MDDVDVVSFPEIAERLGLTIPQVKNAYARAVKKLRLNAKEAEKLRELVKLRRELSWRSL